MSIDIFEFMKDVARWSYDNGWQYNGQSWDAYRGHVYARGNYLVMLNQKQGTVVLHYEDGKPRELWSGQINERDEFDRLVQFLKDYDQQYRVQHNLHPTYDYERDLLREYHERILQSKLPRGDVGTINGFEAAVAILRGVATSSREAAPHERAVAVLVDLIQRSLQGFGSAYPSEEHLRSWVERYGPTEPGANATTWALEYVRYVKSDG
jgi:hypothetical protein